MSRTSVSDYFTRGQRVREYAASGNHAGIEEEIKTFTAMLPDLDPSLVQGILSDEDDETRYTALIIAGLNNHTECARVLIAHGIDPEEENSRGLSFLDVINAEMIEALGLQEADARRTAVLEEREEIEKYLKEHEEEIYKSTYEDSVDDATEDGATLDGEEGGFWEVAEENPSPTAHPSATARSSSPTSGRFRLCDVESKEGEEKEELDRRIKEALDRARDGTGR